MKKTLIRKIEGISDEYEKSLKKAALKLKILAVLIGVIGALVLFFYLFYQVSKFYDEYRVESV